MILQRCLENYEQKEFQQYSDQFVHIQTITLFCFHKRKVNSEKYIKCLERWTLLSPASNQELSLKKITQQQDKILYCHLISTHRINMRYNQKGVLQRNNGYWKINGLISQIDYKSEHYQPYIGKGDIQPKSDIQGQTPSKPTSPDQIQKIQYTP
ncbi:hypothetical protein ABPG74_006695 [Tetrahymena malaccensis]